MQVVLGANLDLSPTEPGAPRRQYGNALLSAYDILDWHNILLPRLGNDEQRPAGRAGGRRRRVVDAHPRHPSATRLPHAWLLQVDAIRQVLASSEPPVVLAGDLNARPDTTEIRQLTDALVDAWATAGRGPGYTFSARRPRARIDYVASSDDLVAWGAEVLRSQAADHLPLVADLQSAGLYGPG